MPKTLFISDLHLAENHPATTDTFLRFARTLDSQVEALYVLGDLFDYWVGDDDLQEPFHQTIVRAFTDVTNRGIDLFFMHGNRDFLLGEVFSAACGGSLLNDPTSIDLYGTPTLLMHGDTLCTDDVEYMRFRAMVRDPMWQKDFLAKPLVERRAIGAELRRQSEQAKQLKSSEITDASASTIEAVLRAHDYPYIIHGHTHRPMHHIYTLDSKTCERWVLTDWHDNRGGYLEVTPMGWTAHTLP